MAIGVDRGADSLPTVTPTVALTIAGSDSGGCAGIEADLKTFAAFGLHGAVALSAVTAQHTRAVLGVVALDPSFVTAQIDAVVDDLSPKAVKTGMLATPAIVAAVADEARAGRLHNLVVDPVLVSTSGHPLMDPGGVDANRDLLLPHAAVLTPNLAEAAMLTGRPPDALATTEDMASAASELRALGAQMVVVKGGHLDRRAGGPREPIGSPDVVAGPEGTVVLAGDRVATGNDHGSGCTLSAAIAAGLALGTAPIDAVAAAKDYVRRALCGAVGWRLGSGRGPLDHFGWTSRGHR